MLSRLWIAAAKGYRAYYFSAYGYRAYGFALKTPAPSSLDTVLFLFSRLVRGSISHRVGRQVGQLVFRFEGENEPKWHD